MATLGLAAPHVEQLLEPMQVETELLTQQVMRVQSGVEALMSSVTMGSQGRLGQGESSMSISTVWHKVHDMHRTSLKEVVTWAMELEVEVRTLPALPESASRDPLPARRRRWG